jgi:hypothetical protein
MPRPSPSSHENEDEVSLCPDGRLRVEMDLSWIELWKGETSSSNSYTTAG